MPVLNVFRMTSKTSGKRIATTSSAEIPLDEIMDLGVRDHPDVAGLPSDLAIARLTHFRIDAYHSNAYAAWRRMGSPVAVDNVDYAKLEEESQLTLLENSPANIAVANGKADLSFTLPRQGVSLLVLEWD